MGISLTQDYVERVLESHDVKLLSEYTKSTEKMEMICSCGGKFNKSFKYMRRHESFRCNECVLQEQVIKKKNSYEYVSEYVDSLGLKLLSNSYKNNKTKLKLECKCGHMFYMNYNNLTNGHGCPKCAKSYRYNYIEVKERVEELGFKLLSKEYKNNECKLKLECKCGHMFYRGFGNLKRNSKCPNCEGMMRYSLEYVKSYASIYGFDVLSGDYINEETNMKFKCSQGHIFERTFKTFRITQNCPSCSNPYIGENKTCAWLDSNGIHYEVQKKFDELKGVGGGMLSYDFYLPGRNVLIEYQGKQHEVMTEIFHKNIQEFEIQQEHDRRKREYAKNNNLKLIEIWYYDIKNIGDILARELHT